MTDQSCRVKIQSRMKSLTNAESKVAAYVLENFEDILHCTVTELAEKVGSSEASVVRFCKSIGYKGYQDFKINAARDVIPPDKQFNPSLSQGDSTAAICQKIFESEIMVLNETLMILDLDMLEKAALAITKAERIEVFGSGGSAMVGMDASHKFLKIGVHANISMDADIQAMTAPLMKKGDVAIGISHSGSSQHVVRCMQIAKKNGAVTIACSNRRILFCSHRQRRRSSSPNR